MAYLGSSVVLVVISWPILVAQLSWFSHHGLAELLSLLTLLRVFSYIFLCAADVLVSKKPS